MVDVAAGADLSRPGPTVTYDAATNSATFAVDGSVRAAAAGRYVVWSVVAEAATDALLAAPVEL